MPNRSKGRNQTKSDPLVLQVGGRALVKKQNKTKQLLREAEAERIRCISEAL